MQLRTFTTVFVCLLLDVINAQSIAPHFEVLGVNEGLSQSSVYAIYQDKAGFMWYGTADGLNRYDGSEIKVFKNKESLSRPGNSNLIRGNLCEDAGGNIWFTTETGLYFFDRKEEALKTAWVFPTHPSGIVYYDILFIDAEQNPWLQNKSLGIIKRDIKSGRSHHYPYPFPITDFRMNSSKAVIDNEGNIWFSLYLSQGWFRFNIYTHRYELFFPEKNFTHLFFGRKRTYFLTEKKIYRYDSVSAKMDSMSLPADQKLLNIQNSVEDRYGRIWLSASPNGLLCIDIDRHKIHPYRYDNGRQKSLASDYVTVLTCDRSENLWIGTDGGGVCKLNLKPSRFNLFPLTEGGYPFLKDYFTRCFFEDGQKRIWFGTNNGGLCIYDPANGRVENYLHRSSNRYSIPSNNVSSLLKDKDGNMWVGTSMGLCLFNETQQRFLPVPMRFSTHFSEVVPFIYRFRQLRNGDLLAATNHGLVRIKKDKRGQYVGLSEYCWTRGVPGAIDVIELPGNELWMAVPLSGLYRTAPAYGKDTFSVKERYFPSIDIRSLHADERESHVLWIASGKGLIRFDTKTKKYTHYNEDQGMANSYVYGILEDEKHNLWLSTNGGLSYFNRQAQTFRNYVAKDGLQSNEFNTGAFYKGPSETIYFGGIKGFNWFRSQEAEQPQHQQQPPVAITGIGIDDRPFEKDEAFFNEKKIIMSYDQNNLWFSFAVLDYTRPQANKIRYQLEGWDPTPFTTYNLQVRYPRLSPGQYTLKVKASNAGGIWGKEERILIIVEAPFWQRWWFYAIGGFILFIAAIVITKSIAQRRLKQQLRHLEKLQAVEAERNRISKDMHDEIGSGLTQIALMSELLQTQQNAEAELKKDVGAISQSARKLVQSMSEIVWAMNPQNDTLESLFAYLREQAGAYFEPFDMQLTVDFPDEVPFIKLSNEQRRNLFLVAKESLNNTLKHAAASHVCFSAKRFGSTVHFYIQDNGKGFDPAKTRHTANGLKNMNKRMQDIGGTFTIQTGKEGTLVVFSVLFASGAKKGRTTFLTSFPKN